MRLSVTTSTVIREPNIVKPRAVDVLPLRPIWRGFLTNSLLYAAILWIVLFARRDVRQFIRRKRGLCVACGYDLRHADHNACPECGRAYS